MKIGTQFLLLVFLAVFASLPARAEPLCESFDAEPPHFKALYQKGKELGRAICLRFGEKIDSSELGEQFAAFARAAGEASATAFAGTAFAEQMQVQMEHFESLADKGINKARLPDFEVIPDQASFGEKWFFRFADWNTQGEADKNDAACMQSGGASCDALLTALATAIGQYKKPYVHLSGQDLSKRAQILQAQWDRYFEEARPQTLWDALFTTAREQDYLAQSRLVGPMQKQWFVLHPSIVIENVSAAVDGDELSEALAIEWIGVNWWNGDTSPIGYPFGISLASVYSDRADIEEVGHGLMFHFGNSLTVGWTDHDGDEGWSVSVEFLSLLARKKQNWDTYKASIEEFIEAEKQSLLGTN